jgi:FkbM family methyltransferase
MKKILVYVGLNYGGGLYSRITSYDIIVGVEPIPEIFYSVANNLKQMNLPHNKKIYLFKCALSDYEGVSKFYLSSNPAHVSSSLSTWDNADAKKNYPHIKQLNEIEVKVKRLDKILEQLEIDHIDYLITDTQGSDYKILNSVKFFIDNKKIKNIQCENFIKPIYDNLANKFEDTKTLLEKNYNLAKIENDGTEINISEIQNHVEIDSFWALK